MTTYSETISPIPHSRDHTNSTSKNQSFSHECGKPKQDKTVDFGPLGQNFSLNNILFKKDQSCFYFYFWTKTRPYLNQGQNLRFSIKKGQKQKNIFPAILSFSIYFYNPFCNKNKIDRTKVSLKGPVEIYFRNDP